MQAARFKHGSQLDADSVKAGGSIYRAVEMREQKLMRMRPFTRRPKGTSR